MSCKHEKQKRVKMNLTFSSKGGKGVVMTQETLVCRDCGDSSEKTTTKVGAGSEEISQTSWAQVP
jgi:hypothetical protein